MKANENGELKASILEDETAPREQGKGKMVGAAMPAYTRAYGKLRRLWNEVRGRARSAELRVHHYTTGYRLVGILGSGVIELSDAAPAPRSADAVWFSEAEEYDRIAVRVAPGDAGDRRMAELEENCGLVRISVSTEGLLTMSEYEQACQLPPGLAAMYASTGRDGGSHPEKWWTSFVPVPAEKWLAVETLESGKWLPIAASARPSLLALSLVLPPHLGESGDAIHGSCRSIQSDDDVFALSLEIKSITLLTRQFMRLGHYRAALVTEKTALAMCTSGQNSVHMMTVRLWGTIGELYYRCGYCDAAIAALEPLPEICDRILGPGNLDGPEAMYWLAMSYASLQKYELAKGLFITASRRIRDRFGRTHDRYVSCRVYAAICCARLGLAEEQEAILAEVRRSNPGLDADMLGSISSTTGGHG